MTWSLEVVWKVAESRAKSRVRLKHDFTTDLNTTLPRLKRLFAC